MQLYFFFHFFISSSVDGFELASPFLYMIPVAIWLQGQW